MDIAAVLLVPAVSLSAAKALFVRGATGYRQEAAGAEVITVAAEEKETVRIGSAID